VKPQKSFGGGDKPPILCPRAVRHAVCIFKMHTHLKWESYPVKSPIVMVALLLLLGLGCTPDPKSGEGFSLPDGDAQRGQETFAQLQCQACHTVSGVEFVELETSDETMISLGGVTPRVKTYGDLVTSIINPSHRFARGYSDEQIKQNGESKMRLYNDEMTVTQLTDLVTFLQAHYKVRVYQPTPYMPYY
jgi:sulfur-oxidizing protein SoxX